MSPYYIAYVILGDHQRGYSSGVRSNVVLIEYECYSVPTDLEILRHEHGFAAEISVFVQLLTASATRLDEQQTVQYGNQAFLVTGLEIVVRSDQAPVLQAVVAAGDQCSAVRPTGILIAVDEMADDVFVIAVGNVRVYDILVVDVPGLIIPLLGEFNLFVIIGLEHLDYGVDEQYHGFADIGGVLAEQISGDIPVESLGECGVCTVGLEHMYVETA